VSKIFEQGPRISILPYGILGEYLAAMRSYRLSSSGLKRLQDLRLQKLISFAYNRVPYYHRLLKDQRLGPSDFNHAEDLQKLPPLSKETILRSLPGEMLARGIRIKSKRLTSGATGPPTAFFRGPVTERRILALRLRRMHLTGVHGWEKAVYLPYWGADVSCRAAALRGPRVSTLAKRISSLPNKPRDLVLGYRVLPLGPGNTEAVSMMLARYKPSILRARPSYLRRVAGIVKELSPSFSVSKIFTEGEILTKGTRKDLSSAYGAEVFDEYGSSEFSGLGCECKLHRGIHLNSDYFVFEFLGKDGYPAGEGERAELVVTGLMDDAMPLIRYQIGDYVIRNSGDSCNCGSSLPRLELIEGRTVDGLVTANGELIAPGSIVEHLETALGLRGFQLVQEGDRELLLKVNSRDFNGGALGAAREYLSFVLGGDVSLRTELWEDDEMPIKFRPVTRAPYLSNLAGKVSS
jgi:phenylacetate-CoA ligase